MTKFVGICGISFCGSTLLSRLLDQIPGISAPGELHWLIDNPHGEPGQCKGCAGPCEVIDNEFKGSGLVDESLYERVAQRLGCDVLVSSDKNTDNFHRFVLPKQMDGIVLFKTPEASLWSNIKHHEASPRKSVEIYSRWYETFLDWAPNFCDRHVFVSYEMLVTFPEAMVKTLCRALALPCPDDFRLVTEFKDAPAGHHIGGNGRAFFSDRIFVDEDWREHLDPYHFKEIRRSERARTVYSRMRAASIKPTFSI